MKSFYLSLIYLLIILFSVSCKKIKKSKVNFKDKQTEILSEHQKIHSKIVNFLKENETITEDKFNKFYLIFQKDYHLSKDKNKYNAIVNLVKKTLKEKNLEIKNKQYQDLKEQLLKI